MKHIHQPEILTLIVTLSVISAIAIFIVFATAIASNTEMGNSFLTQTVYNRLQTFD